MKKPALRAWGRITSTPWLITQAALEQVAEIALRQTAESWEAVAAKMGKPLENTWSTETRDGVAIVPVMGPIFRYANLMTAFSGATSVEELATDFRAALDNPDVKGILLNVNSPGGQADGINELGVMIRAGRDVKPVRAYVGGQAASAAYWLASQASEIVADPTALIGSIGVVMSFADRSGADEKAGVKRYEIISRQSPKKRLTPATDAGREAWQVSADDLADEFIAAVANGRGLTSEKVLADFGQGDEMVARKAMAAGMIDRLGSFEGMITEMKDMPMAGMLMKSFGGSAAKSNEGGHMAEGKTAEQLAAEAESAKTAAFASGKAEGKTEGVAEGRKTERARIGAILGCEEAKGREGLARTIATETDTDAEAAKKLLAAAPVQGNNNPLAGAMAGVKNPKVGAGGGEDQEDESALVKSIVSFLPKREGK